MTGFGSGFGWMAACVAAVGLLSGSVRAQGLEDKDASFPRIASVNGVVLDPEGDGGKSLAGEPLTLEQIARYDLLFGVYGPWEDEATWPVLREKLACIRQANPAIIIIGQTVQAESAYDDPAAVPEGMPWRKPPDGAWLLDLEGKRLPSGSPDKFLLNLREPSVLEWLTECCVQEVRERGYDGVLLGGMGPTFPDWTLSRIASGYTVDADGDAMQDDLEDLHFLWQDAKRQLCADVREALGHDVVIVAGGTPQNDYIYEHFNGWSTGTPLLELRRGNTEWTYELERYISWTEAPHRPHTTTWISVPDPAAAPESAKDRSQRMRFGLAAALMADGYFAFVAQEKQEAWFPEFDAPLGRPLKPAHVQPGDLWQREYEGGVAVVNPTAEAAPIEFQAAQRDLSTGAVGTAFTIQPKDGRIFVPAG